MKIKKKKKTQIVMKLKNSNWDEIINTNYDETQQLKL